MPHHGSRRRLALRNTRPSSIAPAHCHPAVRMSPRIASFLAAMREASFAVAAAACDAPAANRPSRPASFCASNAKSGNNAAMAAQATSASIHRGHARPAWFAPPRATGVMLTLKTAFLKRPRASCTRLTRGRFYRSNASRSVCQKHYVIERSRRAISWANLNLARECAIRLTSAEFERCDKSAGRKAAAGHARGATFSRRSGSRPSSSRRAARPDGEARRCTRSGRW